MRNLDRYSVLAPSDYPTADIMMRGILIIAIVLGHNRLFTTQWPWFFGFAYKWHVHGFFFLALAGRGLREKSSKALLDVLVRFLVPFVLFLTLATVANALRSQFSLAVYLQALAIGSARLINAACDMSLFWFLPAFAGYLLFLGAAGAFLARNRAAPAVLCVICATCLTVSWFLPRSIALLIPLGLPIVAYIFPGSVVFCAVNGCIEKTSPTRRLFAAAVCITASVLCVLYVGDTRFDISLFKYGQGSLFIFASGIMISVSANLALKAVCLTIPDGLVASLLAIIGRGSLVIFLVHSFIQAPLVKGAQAFLPPTASVLSAAVALVIAGIAIAAGLWVERMLRQRPGVSALVLPRDRNAFLQALQRLRRNPWHIARRA